jgi:threonine dehydrogenase-like Zn-dependent dehydrogenase
MKTLRIAAPFAAPRGEVPRPNLASEQVRIRIQHVGYRGSDLNTYRGSNPLVAYPARNIGRVNACRDNQALGVQRDGAGPKVTADS